MTERFLRPLPFFTTIKEIGVFYIQVFPHIIGIILLAALVQAFVSILMPQNPTVGLAVSILGSVVSMFFYGWILYHADTILMGRSETQKDGLHVAKKRFLPLLGVLVVYIFIIGVLILFGYGMEILGRLLHITLLFAVITLCILLFVTTLFAFTMPAVVLEQMPVFKSFEYSVKLVWGHFWRTFALIFIWVIPVVLLSLALLLLPTRNIWVITLYEYIYHIITYPLMVSLILVLYHDLKTRHQKVGFKQVAEHK